MNGPKRNTAKTIGQRIASWAPGAGAGGPAGLAVAVHACLRTGMTAGEAALAALGDQIVPSAERHGVDHELVLGSYPGEAVTWWVCLDCGWGGAPHWPASLYVGRAAT